MMTRYQGHPGNVGLDQLKRELITEGRVRPVEDVLSPAVDSPSSPRPAPGTSHITVEELERLRDVPQLVRTRKEQRRRRYTRAADYERDRAGRPCACGTTPDEVCILHAQLLGHRRHVRPE